MPKFKLIAEHDNIYGNPSGHKVTHEFEVDFLPEVLENIDLFIRGVGYFPNGTLDYSPDQEYYGLDPDYGDHGGGSTLDDYPEVKEQLNKSSYYFDTERNK